MRLGRLAALALVAVPGGAWAEGPEDACALIGRDEFQALTGREEYTDPEAMPYGSGSVCGFGNGQVVLWTGPDSADAFERMLAGFGQQDLPRTPVEGLGDGAFALFHDPEDEYQDHGAFVVFGAGPPKVAVSVNAVEGERAETALPAALAVAKAVAGRL